MLLARFRASRSTCFRASNYAGKIERVETTEKCRDPKDFKRCVGRPDDLSRRRSLTKSQTTIVDNQLTTLRSKEKIDPSTINSVVNRDVNKIVDKLKLLPNLGRKPVQIEDRSINKPSPCDLIVINRPTTNNDNSASKSLVDKPSTIVDKSKRKPLTIVDDSLEEIGRHRIYASGLTETGALGLHKPNEGRRLRKFMPRPLRHQFAEEVRVITVECGYGFTLFYVKNDSPIKLYGCGLNSDYQLGPSELDVVTYPIPIDIRLTSSKTKLTSISAGRAHSGVTTDDEGIFLFGSNRYGQCGRSINDDDTTGKISSVCTITQIKNVGNEKAVKVSCGQDHTIFITTTGKLFSCGLSEMGQTGLGPVETVWKPTRIEGDVKYENIVKVEGKSDTILALNDRGEIFGWGSNEFRQLKDDDDTKQIDEPIRLKTINDLCGKIVDVAAGSSFCIVLNEEGDVFVWGRGILGGGPDLASSSRPVLLPRTLFGCNDYRSDERTIKVFCGVDHMIAINSLRHVYAWGKNKYGSLGIGQLRDQYFPYKLAHGAKALHVSGGVDHTFVLTDHS